MTDKTHLIKREVSESEQKYRALLDTTSAAIVLVSCEWLCLDFNEAWCTFLGYSREELLGLSPGDFTHPDDKELSKDKHASSVSGDDVNYRIEKRYIHKSGEVIWGDLSAKAVKNNHGKVVSIIATVVDISDRIAAQKKILQQAHFDHLTKLPNRFLTFDRLNQLLKDAKRQSKKVAVLFLDLDGFKSINDLFGHEAGDLLLIAAAKRFSSAIREGDTVGRLGGDEFLITLGDLSHASEAMPVVNNIIHSFKEPFMINKRNIMMSTSIGIAVFPDDGQVVSDLLRSSDSAMYFAKQQGRNTYSYFTAIMNKKMIRRLEIEEQIQGALAKDEFKVCYQPKINMVDKNIMGAEALLRWFNPVLGHVAPDEFIPVAEQMGLIIGIGEFVFKEAIAATDYFNQHCTINFKMAINVSPLQFRDPQLLSSIKNNLSEFHCSPENLEIEITEGVLASVVSSVKDTLQDLSDLNINIAMDDFGTGYSSLSYLRKYPFNILKIDRSFISDIETNKADLELVNATISMAHALKLKVVAEGVETEAQHKMVKDLGCDFAQGYLYSKAIDKEEFIKFFSC